MLVFTVLSSYTVCPTLQLEGHPLMVASHWWLPATDGYQPLLTQLPFIFVGRLAYRQPEDTPCSDGVKMRYTKQSEMRTKTTAYFEENKPYEGRTEYEWGLDIFITNSRVTRAAGCRQLSFLWHAFGKDTLLSGCVYTLWNSINQQILKLAIGCKSFCTLSQLMG
jgi:hypothetical protein